MSNIQYRGPEAQALSRTLILPPARRYIDKVAIWLIVPLTTAQVNELQELNRGLFDEHGKVHCHRKRMEFLPQWKHRLQINQPKLETLLALQAIVGDWPIFINYVEIASDHIFARAESLEDAFDRLFRGWIKLNYRKTQGVRRVIDDDTGEVTRYVGSRRSRSQPVMYGDDCRHTGAPNALHLEWRLRGKATCERYHILTIQHLIDFDHNALWIEKLKHVYELNGIGFARLGRYVRNKRNGTRDQVDKWHRYGFGSRDLKFNLDRRVGRLLLETQPQETIQELVGEFGLTVLKPMLSHVQVEVEGETVA